MNSKMRVLVVDDEPGVLHLVQECLCPEYDVITTDSGEEAITLVKTSKPDIVLLDLLMVPLTGFEVLERLRAFSQIPVIVFTARADIGNRALAEGANGFIPKPFRINELLETIRKTLDKKETGAAPI